MRASPIGPKDLPGERLGERVGLLLRAAARAALLGTAAVVLLFACGTRVRPDVIVIVMDTTRADRCSFLNYGRNTTPRLAEFAKDAVVFSQAWSPANWTGPAHASLFTGLRPERHGFHRGSHPYLTETRPVLAEAFRDAGYETACYTNNESLSPEMGLLRGFDRVDLLYQREDRPYPWARDTHERAAEWAEATRASGKPFFLFINDMEPHQPYTPPAEFAASFVRGTVDPERMARARAFTYPHNLGYDVGAEEIAPADLDLLSDLYDAEIAALDREIGALFDRLRAKGMLDDAVVIVLGDHGEHLGEHHLIEHSLGLYAPLLHVPLMVRFPGAFEGGRTVDDVIRIEDVAPTLLELCGLDGFPDVDGLSLRRDLAGRVARGMQPPRDWWSRAAEGLFPKADLTRASLGITSVFDGSRHLLEFSDGSVELYDPVHDPVEALDLAAREPDTVERLRKLRR
jgi:arylsulfatase A-like enzyme